METLLILFLSHFYELSSDSIRRNPILSDDKHFLNRYNPHLILDQKIRDCGNR